jgi:predicted lipoprotein with Yx(FWY)xxD motif
MASRACISNERVLRVGRPVITRAAPAVSAVVLSAAAVFAAVVPVAAAGVSVPARSAGTTVALRHAPSHGKVLDAAGRYVFVHVTAAGKNVSCSAVCKSIWPAVKTTGKPRAGAGVKAAALGQTSKHQVTYRGHPLYYYTFSKRSTVDGASSFGGHWRLLKASGALS